MQQPMNQQQEQLGCQQVQQQMVLCPVRLVYETQILVPPGDQVQPNQTYFINPQNPPPWMQNRNVPNQVVYVQQLPSNIVSTTQHPIDQNQYYLHQNFGNYQLQQQFLAHSPQELRPAMQFTNIVPNMVQNLQQPLTNDRNIGQNIANMNQMQSNPQNQMNLANARMTQVNQTMESPRQVFMNMRPQMSQQTNVTRPVMAMNQIQTMPVQQQLSNSQNLQLQQVQFGQNLANNVGQARSVPSQNVTSVPRAVQPTNIYTNQANNYPNMQSVSKVRDITPEVHKSLKYTIAQSMPNSMPITNNVATNSIVNNNKNFIQSYAYRPIQPRPQIRHVNTSIGQVHSKPVPVHNTPNMFSADKNNPPQNVVSASPNNYYHHDNNTNRKRKSESPDELQKKIGKTDKQSFNVPPQSITVTKLSNEIGVNTSPVHRVDNKSLVNNNTMLQINPNSTQIVVRAPQPNINLVKNTIASDSIANDVRATHIPIHLIEKEKLIRNTVFTQARGRLLQEKKAGDETKPVTTEIISKDETKIIKIENPALELHSNKNIESKPLTVSKSAIDNTVADVKEENAAVSNPESNITVKEELKVAKEEINNVNKDINEIKDTKAEEFSKITFKHDRDFSILTHVVDGYVIQESNIAFPIRKPLKEKTIFANALTDSDSKERNKDDFKMPIDLPLLPLHYLHANNDSVKEPEEKKEETKENGNPFCQLEHTTVKSWTTEDLAEHLSKYKWKETVSVLRDHEIDGESLFLVSRSQLLHIGVPENHAVLICEFVKG